MSLEQQITSLVDASNKLTNSVTGKVGEIDERMNKASREFDAFKRSADNRYLNVVSATSSSHKLQNISFGDWEYDQSDISPTRGSNALILAKKIPFSVEPMIRGDMTMLGTINALRVHATKYLQIRRFTIKYCESYTVREIQLFPDEINAAEGWEIREVMLPALDPTTPFYVLSTTRCLDELPHRIAFEGKLTFDGVFGHAPIDVNDGQYLYTGKPIMLSDVGYSVQKEGA